MTPVILGLLSGVAFGFVIQRAGATNPDLMARAHLMRNPDIPRFMLAAVVISAVGLFGLKSVDAGNTMLLPTSIVATGLAAIIFGIGWGLSGYCPGTTWAAVGEGRLDAVFALLGGLAGAALFAHFHEQLIPYLYDPTNLGPLTVPGIVGSDVAGLILVAAMFSGGIYLIGIFWSGDDE